MPSTPSTFGSALELRGLDGQALLHPSVARLLDRMGQALEQLLQVQERQAQKSGDKGAQVDLSSIRAALEANGTYPLNVQNLRGQLSEPQVASAPTVTALPSLTDSQYEDGALIAYSGVVYRRNRTSEPGSWDAITAAGALSGNPTAQVGLAAVNGVSSAFMRADAAPALDQSIAPTWTGNHRFNGRVGIGVAADASSALRIDSTTGAFLPPRMTTAQRDALTAINGMVIYNTDTGALNYYKAGVWTAI